MKEVPPPRRGPRSDREADESGNATDSLDLVRRATQGDREAENEICARYLPRLHRWAKGRLPRGARPAMDTGDLVQDVLARAIRAFPDFAPKHEGSFPAFLKTILDNRVTDLGRAGQRRPTPGQLDPNHEIASDGATPYEETVRREEQARFQRVYQRLSPRDQQLLYLRVEAGHRYDTIAGVLDSTPDAVRIATRRAMQKLTSGLTADLQR
jgi:RNA polymerase sigma-70 factor (ECF subfamily)